MNASPEIRWQFDEPRLGFSIITALTEEARGFLHWMATDGPAPVQGVWDGMSLIVLTEGDGDYLHTVLGGNGFLFEEQAA